MTEKQFSPQQEKAIDEAVRWAKTGSGQVFSIFGFAGAGKTTLAKEIAKRTEGRIGYGALTGKAASVMRRKGCDDAATIHSQIYRAKSKRGEPPTFKLDLGSEVGRMKLFILDEVSMVDEKLGSDILSFGTKVLVLGDPGQLPPIKGAGYFTSGTPDVMLTEIHRQALENPIIRLSMQIREGGRLQPGQYGASRVIERAAVDKDDLQKTILEADQIIVGRNRTRHQYNGRLRELLGRGPTVEPGDKLVCLKNDHNMQLFNGTLWRAKSVKFKDKHYDLSVESFDDDHDNGVRGVVVREEFFKGTEATVDWKELKGTQQMTYGYALTCHKSQGSQWNNIVIFDEGDAFRDDAKAWRYTAVTRAAERMTLIV